MYVYVEDTYTLFFCIVRKIWSNPQKYPKMSKNYYTCKIHFWMTEIIIYYFSTDNKTLEKHLKKTNLKQALRLWSYTEKTRKPIQIFKE
jgi:hypothetical protein